MVLLQNTKPKITKPKIPKVKNIVDQNLNFVKNQVKKFERPRTENNKN